MSAQDNYGSQIRQKGHDIVVDIVDLREIVKEAVGAKFEALKDGASDKLASLKDNAASMARNTGARATEIVSNSPWKSMAAAAAAGVLAAWFFRRK